MKKVLRKWLVATMAVALVLASSIGVLAAGGASEDAGIKVVKKSDGTAYKMFVVSESSAKVNGDKIDIKLSTKSKSYDRIYFGNKDTTPKVPYVQGNGSGGWSFKITIGKDKSGEFGIVLGREDGSWHKEQLYLYVPGVEDKTNTEGIILGRKTPEGTYEEASFFKVKQYSAALSKNEKNREITVTTDCPYYNKIFVGQIDNADATKSVAGSRTNGWNFEFSVSKDDAGKDLDIVIGYPNENWYTSNELVMKIPTLEALNPSNPGDEDNNNSQQPAEGQLIIPDGTYSVNAVGGPSMFNLIDNQCKLVVKGESVSAIVTLSSKADGLGYDYLYVGTGSQAVAAGESTWSKVLKVLPYSDTKVQRLYKIDLTKDALKDKVPVAARSGETHTWGDKHITFDLSTLKVYSVGTSVDDAINNVVADKTPSDNNPAGNANNTNNTLTQNQIKDKLQSVDSSSVVKDGTYTPSFGFEGGSGRATITCNKVVVKNGKATATIVFSSPNFTWVKTGGKTYYNENKGGNSTFTIPVTLNGKTAISAETTAMSQPHVVDYTLYCFIDGTKVTTKNNTSNDTIELGTEADNTTADKDDANSWGEFDSETDATKAYESKIKGLTTGLVVVGGYAVAGTAFAAVRFRKLRKK